MNTIISTHFAWWKSYELTSWTVSTCVSLKKRIFQYIPKSNIECFPVQNHHIADDDDYNNDEDDNYDEQFAGKKISDEFKHSLNELN